MEKENGQPKVKIAALSDIHVQESNKGSYRELFTEISQKADVLCFCGDLTDHGLASEAEILASQLQACTIPVVGVLGNHDYEKDQQEEIKQVLKSRMYVLDGDSTEINGVGFAGTKGFGGGFDDHILGPFGEKMTKAFVQECVDDVLRLESALSLLRTTRKIVLMHYAPIKKTCENEPPEIFPFLGSSRYEEPINLFNVTTVFHGHAHFGSHSGKTMKGIPVYNVAYPLMQKVSPEQPYKLIEV